MWGAMRNISLLALLLMATLLSKSSADQCTDSNGESESGKGWNLINKLSNHMVTVKDKKFNSTYTIGICKNLMPDEWDQHSAALEHTQDNRTIILGRYNDSAIMYGSHWILLKYLDGEPYEGICNNSTRQAAIMFVCNHDISTMERAKIIDENMGRQKNCYHLFEIEHCLACVSDGCNAFFHHFSPGTVILMGFFSLIGAYLLFGWIFTRFVRKKRGWKQIPNAEFWQEIGHLQADGCAMVCRCGKRKEDEYNLIGGDSRADNPNEQRLPSNSLLSDDDDMLAT